MMGLLYDVETHTVNYHLKKVFDDSELEADSVIRNFRITAADGKNYNTKHYNLAAIIAVGYKVNSERAVQFRKWANTIIEEFTIKGYVMDDERLKNDGSVLTRQYFEEQLQRIREIRLSERTNCDGVITMSRKAKENIGTIRPEDKSRIMMIRMTDRLVAHACPATAGGCRVLSGCR